jgi:hypothetical protein
MRAPGVVNKRADGVRAPGVANKGAVAVSSCSKAHRVEYFSGGVTHDPKMKIQKKCHTTDTPKFCPKSVFFTPKCVTLAPLLKSTPPGALVS